MADLSPTVAQVAPVNETQYVAKTYIAAVAITAGQLVYLNSSGKAALARANATGTIQNLLGVATHSAAANKPVEVMITGSVYGLGVSSLAYGTKLYASTTAGGGFISDTAISGTGNFNVVIGTVEPMSDSDLTKVAWIQVNHSQVFTAL